MAEKTVLDLYDSDEDTTTTSTSSEEDAYDNTIDDPSPRFWHFSQLVKGNVYVGGGNIPQYKKKKTRDRLLKTIEEFSVKERKWRQRETTGDHHPGLTGVATCASFGKYLFAYGGNNSKDLNGVLSQLDLDTFIWSQLSPETADGPMKKDASGMVHFGEDSLAVICGYATPRDRMQLNGGSSDRDSRFIIREGPSAYGDGWTNEMHIFNHKTKDNHPGTWTPFSFEGPRPPPCADFSFTSVDFYRAVLYGGRRGADENSNDLYVIDFSERKITRIKPESKEDKWPKMRLGHHAACCLDFDAKSPQLLISGGRIKHELPPKDIWILNLATQKWKQVELPIDDSIKDQLARWGHTFTAITHSEGFVEVTMFGGSPGYYEVTWDVHKGKDHFQRLAFPVSFIGFLKNKEFELDVVKTTESMPFDLDSPVMLDVLYSMERDKIPIRTELVTNKKIRSTICTEDEDAHFKWPTFTKASFHEPTWENLISILKLVKQDDFIEMIQQYLKKMKAPAKRIKLMETLKDAGAQADFELPGVDVCGETTFVVTHNADIFKWKEYGLELCVSEDSLPKDMDKCKISIIASIAGQYQFPETFSLVSAVFWIRWEPTCKFSKDITMKMEHCAKSENAPTKLSFVRTFCTPKKFPYTFEKIGGCFTKANGTIELKGSSGLAIAARDPIEEEYCARIFYLSQPRVTSYEIDFIVTSNLKAHHTVVKEEYEGKFAVPGVERTFFFESDSITIDIPLGGVEIEKGWKIKPLTNPMVLKQIVDSHEEGKVIPKCQFSAKTMVPDGEEVPPLQYQATLLGAKYPDNNIIIVTFNISPTSWIISGSSHASRNRKRPVSDSDFAPSPKRVLLHKTKSQDSNIPITSEDVDTSEDLSTDLQGVEVLQETTVTVTNSECTFEWEGYGLKLHIPENSLPSDMKKIKLTIIASIAGHYKFPENFSLFSGVYWFFYEPLNVKVQLKKPVKLEIQHCAKSDCTSSLSFVRASSNQEKLPYTFKYLTGGDFTSCSGTLEVNNFCGIFIAGLFGAKRYIAKVFYHRHETVYWDICIAVILDDDPHRRASEKKFFKAVDDHDEVRIDFESDKIILDIPQDALEIEGWMLYPTGYPMIKKESVDSSLPDQIPYCRILADVVDPDKARGRPLCHRVNLLGAKPPSDFINLKLFPSVGGTKTSIIGSDFIGKEPNFSVASSSVLCEDHLRDVVREMAPRKSSYYALGRQLGLPVGILESIQMQYESTDLDRALNEVLLAWLRQRYDTAALGKPSWQMLVRAVADQGGLNNPALATQIASRHTSPLPEQ